MRFKCGCGQSGRKAYYLNWHRWFAWRPVRLGDNDCRWLEYVERKYVSYGPLNGTPYDPHYRIIPKPLLPLHPISSPMTITLHIDETFIAPKHSSEKHKRFVDAINIHCTELRAAGQTGFIEVMIMPEEK